LEQPVLNAPGSASISAIEDYRPDDSITEDKASSNSDVSVTVSPAQSEATPSPDKSFDRAEDALHVRGVTISFGESISSLLSKLGSPNRIDETEYAFNYYIYNNDYSRLLFVAVKDNKVVGFYTDSVDFTYLGISYGSGIDSVSNSLNQSFAMEEVLKKETGKYTINVLMDKIGTGKVTGLSILATNILKNKPKKANYTDTVRKNIELMVYDLTNSIRVRNKKPVLSWSSSAALAARKHSVDMAENHFFNHINPRGEKPGERLLAESVYYKTCGENIIAGYPTAILSTHAWYNSSGHRKVLLDPNFRYLGVGFAYLKDSRYHTYLTQDFYR
jgi:uncharacterized protein YkwD